MPNRPPLGDAPVSVAPRKSVTPWAVRLTTVQEFSAAGQNAAQQIVPANPNRLAVVVYAPAGNTGVIYVGGRDVRPPPTGSVINGLDCEPGTGWTIDDTLDAIYAIAQPLGGAQTLKWYEVVDRTRDKL